MAQNKAQALYDFWSGFTWPAYDENTVPDNAALPYITFETGVNGFDDGPLSLSASLWDRSTAWTTVEEKAAQIADYLGLGGAGVSYPGGRLWIHGNLLRQRMQEPEDDSLRRIVLTIEAEYLS